MNCADFVELSGLYALDALSPAEQADAAAHLEDAHHDGCFEALRRAAAGTEVLARSLVPVKPGDALFRQIEARLGVTAPAGAKVQALRPRRRELAAWGFAAAAALLLLVNVLARRSDQARSGAAQAELSAKASAADKQARRAAEEAQKTAQQLKQADDARSACSRELASLRGEHEAQETALALLRSPSAQVISLKPPPGQGPLAARALVDLAQKKGMLLASALQAPAGKDYELWIIRGKLKLPAGLLRARSGGVVLASIDPQLFADGRPDSIAITLEPAGGMPQPSGPIVLVGALPKS